MNAVLICLTAVIAFVLSALGSEEDELIRSIYAKCREETQIEENEMESFKKMELPTSNKGQCMMGCLMREAAIIVNGRFDKEGAMRVAERYYSDKQDDMEKARIVIDICEKQIEDETEECSIAGKLANCVIEEAQRSLNKVCRLHHATFAEKVHKKIKPLANFKHPTKEQGIIFDSQKEMKVNDYPMFFHQLVGGANIKFKPWKLYMWF